MASLICIAVAVRLLVGTPARAADVPQGSPARAVLYLANGDFVAGDLQPSQKAAVLRWQSPFFTAPFHFVVEGVNALHFPLPAELPKPKGEYCFELAGGDVLFGSLLSLNGDEAELDVPRFGRLHVARSGIRRIYRWSDSADLIHLGPNGLTGWQAEPAKAWREEFGQLLTDQEATFVRRDFGLPARAAIEFEISWKKKPDFVLALGVKDEDDEKTIQHAFRFEIWENDLVVLRETAREADVASVQEIEAGTSGRAHLQAYLDQERGRCLVFSAKGVQLADLKFAPGKPQTQTGIRLTNRRGDVRLERMRIVRWNGDPPREIQADKSRIHRADGSIVYGQVTRFDAAANQFVVRDDAGESRLAADQIAGVFLSPPGDAPPRAVRAVYQDGVQLSGELTSVEEGLLRLASPGIRESLSLPLDELRSLVVLRHAGLPSTDGSAAGVLEMEGVRLRGKLVDGTEQPEASCLVWKPLASATASPLRPGASGRIVYREPPPAAPKTRAAQPAARQPVGFVGGFIQAFSGNQPLQPVVRRRALHLRTGDTIPCDVTKIDELGLSFTTSLSDATFVPHDKIKAVELALDPANTVGLNKTKRERLLTLPRMQKESPPTHLVRSKNGDYLRGRVIDMDDKTLHLEVRLETKEVPRDRVSRIIWLHADELEKKGAGIVSDGLLAPGISPAGNDSRPLLPTRVQVVKSDGMRLTFFPQQFADKTLSGKSDVLGACRVGLTQVDQLLIGGHIELAAAQLAYQQWKLQFATEPKFATSDDGQSPDGRMTGTESPLVGKPAPDFELDLLEGKKKFQLSGHKGKVVVLDFWATWCGPCLQSMPQVDAAVREFQDQGVQLIAVNLEEAPKQITSMLERHKLQLTVALDRDGVVAARYAATSIPQTVIIDREGNVARVFIGGGPHLGDQLREALRTVLAP